MTKSVINVTCYQIGDIVHNPALAVALHVGSIRGAILPVQNTNPETGAQNSMVGANGEAPDPSIVQKVYGIINMTSPSYAGTVAYFVTETPAQIVSDINT